ncbi:MAG: hypothetical protein LPK47_08860 [Bacteroidota bacterium]|nr:hypothetical protein [Bacteroidota bacterium]
MKKLILISLSLLLLSGCLPDQSSDPTNFTDDWVGQWTCNETEGDFAPQVYSVEIAPGPEMNTVILRGLYNQGNNFEIRATVGKVSIDIPTQQEDGFMVSGGGYINDNLDRIELTFTINDGSGSDNVKAYMAR